MTRCLFLALTIAIAAGFSYKAEALPSWAELGLGVKTTLSPLDETQVGYMFALGGNLEGPMSLNTRYDPQTQFWHLSVRSDFYTSVAIYNNLGQTVEATTEILDKNYAKQLGFTKRLIRLAGKEFIIDFAESAKQNSAKRIGVDAAMLDTDFLLFELSALIQRKPVDFNTDILLKTRAWRINVDVRYFPPNSKAIAEITKKLPSQYQALLAKSGNGFHCFVMKPTGLIGLLDSTSFYFAYANGKGSPFLGYWGGNGLDLEGLVINLPAAPQ